MISVKDIKKKLEKINIDTAYTSHSTFAPMQKHTPAYQKYFQGWTVKEYQTPGGKIKKKRIYTGQLFVQDLTESELTRKKALTLLLSAAGLALLMTAVYQSRNAGNSWYVYIPQACALFGYIVLLWYGVMHLLLPKKMTVSDYKSNARGLMLTPFILSIVLLVTALTTFIHTVINGVSTHGIISMILLLAAWAATYPVFLLEYRTVYKEVPNENK